MEIKQTDEMTAAEWAKVEAEYRAEMDRDYWS